MEQANVLNYTKIDRSVIDPQNLPPPYGTSIGGQTNVKSYVCPSTPDRPSDYGPYFNSVGLPGPAAIIAPTDYAPTRGVHSSLQNCASAQYPNNPPELNDRGMLGTNDRRRKPNVKIAAVTDGLSNTIAFAEIAGRQWLYYKGFRNAGTSYARRTGPRR